MTARPLFLAVAGFLAFASHAAPPPAAPETLPTAMSRQVEDVRALKKKTDDAAAALRVWYESALDVLKKNAQAKGDLDAVVATDTERRRMDRELTDQEKAGLPPASLQVRRQFDQARATQAAQEKAAYTPLLRSYLATLEALEKRLTQQGLVADALATRQERTAAAQQLSSLTPSPGTPLALESRKPAALPPGGSRFNGAPPLIKVASRLETQATIKVPASEAVEFVAPEGNGRRGRGVMLKNEPGTGKDGSTWSFTYTRSQTAKIMQIVHPHGRGQAVVSLLTNEVTIATPTAWSQVNWRGIGDPKKVKMTRAAAEIFPLKDDQPYHVVSALSPTGSYTLMIDTKVVATGHPGTTSSIDFGEGFTGPDLPAKLAAGYAAIMVGPRDGGVNDCRDITFEASAPEPKR